LTIHLALYSPLFFQTFAEHYFFLLSTYFWSGIESQLGLLAFIVLTKTVKNVFNLFLDTQVWNDMKLSK